MTKQELTKEQLQEQIKQTENTIEQLEYYMQFRNTEAFDAIILNTKNQAITNLKDENWSALKNNIAEIKQTRNFADYIENQSTAIEQKQEELTELNEQLDNYQPTLFEGTDE